MFNTTKEERKFNIFKAENKDEKNWILKSLFPHPHDSSCLHCTFFFQIDIWFYLSFAISSNFKGIRQVLLLHIIRFYVIRRGVPIGVAGRSYSDLILPFTFCRPMLVEKKLRLYPLLNRASFISLNVFTARQRYTRNPSLIFYRWS